MIIPTYNLSCIHFIFNNIVDPSYSMAYCNDSHYFYLDKNIKKRSKQSRKYATSAAKNIQTYLAILYILLLCAYVSLLSSMEFKPIDVVKFKS